MAVQKGPTGIQVSWTPPTPLGDTTGYRIYYSGGGSGSVNVSGRSTNNYLLTDLKNGATYTISIVGISEHFFSDSVDYPNSIPLSELFSKYILLELHSKEHRISSNRRPGVYFLRDFADPAFIYSRFLPRPPTLRSAHKGRNSLQLVRPYGKPRERQAHSRAFNVKDTSKHLFCAIGVAVGEVQLEPLSLPRGACGQRATPPSWYGPTRRLIEARRSFAILPLIPPAYKEGQCVFEGGVYSKQYGT